MWQEYLETVVKDRREWKRPLPGLPRARLSGRADGAPSRHCVEVLGIRHHGPGSARSVAQAARRAARPTWSLIEGAPELDAVVAARRRRRPACRPSPGWSTPSTSPGGRRSTRSRCSRRSGSRCAGRWRTTSTVRFADLPATHQLAIAEVADDGDRPTRSTSRTPATRTGRGAAPDADRHARGGGRVRRPRALVGGRRRAPAATSSLERFAAVRDAMAGWSARTTSGRRHRTTPTWSRTTAARRRCAGCRAGCHAGGPRADRLRLRRLPRARARPGDVSRRRPTTTRCSTGLPKDEGRRDLGAVDVGPARARPAGTAPASTVARAGTSTCSTTAAPTTTCVATAGWSRVARALRGEQLDASPASVVEATRLADHAGRRPRAGRRSG